MNKFSKVIAIALAATMVIGSSVTAFATEEPTYSEGAGTSEGHVEKKATNVVLPTISSAEVTSPFAYTMDPEGLIKDTSHEKYGDAVEFPTTNDTQVYFNNGKKGGEEADKNNVVYANSSVAQKVTNKSSHKINLTVKAEVAEAKTTDIPLVAKSALADASAASLYLGLVVGSGDGSTKEITADAAASKTVEIAGTPGNFKIAVKTNEDSSKTYEYRALTLDEWKASDADNADKDLAAYDATWANTTFNLEGAVTTTKAITSTTTAPKIKVTWSWVDPTANAAPSATATQAILEAGKTADIAVNLGLGDLAATGVSKLVNKGLGNDWIAAGAATYSNGKITLTKTSDVDYLLGAGAANNVFTIEFNDAAKTKVDVTLTAKE